MAWTRDDGWVWVFVLLVHHIDETWTHVAKVSNRFAALQPVYDAVIDRFGRLGPNLARGIKLRGSQGTPGFPSNPGQFHHRSRSAYGSITGWAREGLGN
jgi:hypothetical protein